eukprot:CAMPEP_0119568570 /NCGR_PEP_ID=MMETSP1352-20130426/39261_1 /TAXON_ID=265584 /ORGANISM="Stauroneis constricta, Strain CCMP1120" /LENGTH=444 /DNA_ID=CAMNT_0007617993 /DNA_START=15 /DNA_END=1349 /DNA_ORIENTATION=-
MKFTTSLTLLLASGLACSDAWVLPTRSTAVTNSRVATTVRHDATATRESLLVCGMSSEDATASAVTSPTEEAPEEVAEIPADATTTATTEEEETEAPAVADEEAEEETVAAEAEATTEEASEEAATEEDGEAKSDGPERLPNGRLKPLTSGYFDKDKERFTLFVGNLPFEVTIDDLKEVFSEYGTVGFISLPQHESGRSRGFAFVDMGSAEELKAAAEGATGRELGGRKIRAENSAEVRKRPTRNTKVLDEGMAKLYVGNLPMDTTEDEVKDLFTDLAEISDIYMPLDGAGNFRGFGFVTIPEDAVDATIEAMDGVYVGDRKVTVNRPLPPGQKRAPRAKSTKIFCGNLNFDTTQGTLMEVFGDFGEIFDCYLPVDRNSGNPRGFAFVTMKEEDAAAAIEELDGLELDGRMILVKPAMDRSKQQNTADEGEAGGDSEGGDINRW